MILGSLCVCYGENTGKTGASTFDLHKLELTATGRVSASASEKALHVPASRVNDIVLERRGVSADTALRLTRHFRGDESDAQGWLNLQATYDFKVTQKAVATRVRSGGMWFCG